MNQTTQTVAQAFTANQEIPNVFAGLRLADLPAQFGSMFKVTICAAVENAGMTCQVYAGNDRQPVHTSEVPVNAVAGRIVTRDDVICTFQANAGEKLSLQATDTSGAGNDALFRLIVQRIA